MLFKQIVILNIYLSASHGLNSYFSLLSCDFLFIQTSNQEKKINVKPVLQNLLSSKHRNQRANKGKSEKQMPKTNKNYFKQENCQITLFQCNDGIASHEIILPRSSVNEELKSPIRFTQGQIVLIYFCYVFSLSQVSSSDSDSTTMCSLGTCKDKLVHILLHDLALPAI